SGGRAEHRPGRNRSPHVPLDPADHNTGIDYPDIEIGTTRLRTHRVRIVHTLGIPRRDLMLSAVATPLIVAGTYFAALNRTPPYRTPDVLAYGVVTLAGAGLALWRT